MRADQNRVPRPRMFPSPSRMWYCCAAAGTLWLSISSPLAASAEYELKAAYIARFSEFVEWPQSSGIVPGAPAPFRICVFGAHPIEEPLAKLPGLLQNERVKLEYRRVDSITTASRCAILFVPASAAAQLTAIRQHTGGRGLLTVGDSASARRHGVIINFFFESDRLRFLVDRRAAHAAGLVISSRLLKLADVVE